MIHVAMATDPTYLPWAATAMLSIFDRHPGEEITFHVLHEGDLTEEDLRALRSTLDGPSRVRPHHVADERLRGLPSIDRFRGIVWLRMLLPEILPDVERALFLDADTFVVDGLEELLASPLGGAPIGAVANVVEPRMRPHVRALGLDPMRFLNSGVLLMDLERMRQDGVVDRLIRIARERSHEFIWPDQDALNLALVEAWCSLDPRWNAMNSLWTWPNWAAEVFGEETIARAKGDPAILHFEGPAMCKPWHTVSSHPWRGAYLATVRRTRWGDVPLEDRTAATRFISRLPEGWRLGAYLRLLRVRALVGSSRPQITSTR